MLAPNGIDVERQVFDTQLVQQTPRQTDDLCINRSVLRAEDLYAELVMFPQAAGLRIFVPEHRRGKVEHLGRLRSADQAALDKAAHHAGRSLRPQCDGPPALVQEGVHFLLHDIRRVTNTAIEQLCMFKNRRADLPIAVQRRQVSHIFFNILPFIAFLNGYILGASRRFDIHAYPPSLRRFPAQMHIFF